MTKSAELSPKIEFPAIERLPAIPLLAVVELIVKYPPKKPPVRMLKLRFESSARSVSAAAVDDALNVSTASEFKAY